MSNFMVVVCQSIQKDTSLACNLKQKIVTSGYEGPVELDAVRGVRTKLQETYSIYGECYFEKHNKEMRQFHGSPIANVR